MKVIPIKRYKLLPTHCKNGGGGGDAAQPFQVPVSRLILFGYAIPLNILLPYIMWKTITSSEKAVGIVPSMWTMFWEQRLAMQIIFWIQVPFRLLCVILHWRYFRQRTVLRMRGFICLLVLFQLLESCSTLCLVHIPCDADVFFMIAGLSWLTASCFMANSFVCYKYYRRVAMEPEEELSYILKQKLVNIYYPINGVMWIAYLLHIMWSLPLVHSIFVICQYICGLCYLAYLGTAYFDFYQVQLCYSTQYGYFLSD